jgi:hypothetical protein
VDTLEGVPEKVSFEQTDSLRRSLVPPHGITVRRT